MEEKTYKLLAADDDQDILSILSLILTQEGYQVLTARNGQEVLELADESIDLYILDVNMPILSGFAAANQLSRRFNAPIIFLIPLRRIRLWAFPPEQTIISLSLFPTLSFCFGSGPFCAEPAVFVLLNPLRRNPPLLTSCPLKI